MVFSNSKYLKPIIEGEIGRQTARMLVDTGADYTILNVPKYRICKDENGKPVKYLYE